MSWETCLCVLWDIWTSYCADIALMKGDNIFLPIVLSRRCGWKLEPSLRQQHLASVGHIEKLADLILHKSKELMEALKGDLQASRDHQELMLSSLFSAVSDLLLLTDALERLPIVCWALQFLQQTSSEMWVISLCFVVCARKKGWTNQDVSSSRHQSLAWLRPVI